MKRRIFLIEDEPDLVKIATDLLEEEGFSVQSTGHPDAGLKKIKANPPDLLLLDVRLPDKDGFQVCQELKSDPKTKHVPIIMVSVRSEEADVVTGLEMGAEDYIVKPYRKRELQARVKSVLRRKDFEAKEIETMEVGPFKVDFGRYTARVKNKTLKLTPKEFELLTYFLKKEGRVVTRPTISESVWGNEYTGSSRTIDVHVEQLRRKLGKYGECIVGLKGVGYRFELPE